MPNQPEKHHAHDDSRDLGGETSGGGSDSGDAEMPQVEATPEDATRAVTGQDISDGIETDAQPGPAGNQTNASSEADNGPTNRVTQRTGIETLPLRDFDSGLRLTQHEVKSFTPYQSNHALPHWSSPRPGRRSKSAPSIAGDARLTAVCTLKDQRASTSLTPGGSHIVFDHKTAPKNLPEEVPTVPQSPAPKSLKPKVKKKTLVGDAAARLRTHFGENYLLRLMDSIKGLFMRSKPPTTPVGIEAGPSVLRPTGRLRLLSWPFDDVDMLLSDEAAQRLYDEFAEEKAKLNQSKNDSTLAGVLQLLPGSSRPSRKDKYTADTMPGKLKNDPRGPSKPQAAHAPPPTVITDGAASPSPMHTDSAASPETLQSAQRPSPRPIPHNAKTNHARLRKTAEYGGEGNRGKGRAESISGSSDPSSDSSGTSSRKSSHSAGSDAGKPRPQPRQPSDAVSPLTAQPNGSFSEHLSPPPLVQDAPSISDENARPHNGQPAQATGGGVTRVQVNQTPAETRVSATQGTVSPAHNDSVAEASSVTSASDGKDKGVEKVDDMDAPSDTNDHVVRSLRLPENLHLDSPGGSGTASMHELYHEHVVKAVTQDREQGDAAQGGTSTAPPPQVGDALTLWRETDDVFDDRQQRDSEPSVPNEPTDASGSEANKLDRRRRDSVLSIWADELILPPYREPRWPDGTTGAAKKQGRLGRLWGALMDTLDCMGGDEAALKRLSPVGNSKAQKNKRRSGFLRTTRGALRDALDDTLASV